MSEEVDYIIKRISNLNANRSRYNLFVVLFLSSGVIAFIFSVYLKGNSPFLDELPKFGFGVISSFLGAFFQNEKLKVDNKITSLKYLLSQVQDNPAIKIKLIEKAIEEI